MKWEAVRLIGLLFLASVVLLAAYQAPGDIFLDFGPNDYPYVAGFREEFEIDEPTYMHWSRKRGVVRLPFVLMEEGFDLIIRYKRHIELPAEVRVFVGDRQVDRFLAPQQHFTVRTIAVDSNPQPAQALEIILLAQSLDPRPLGLALDWLQIRPRGWVIPTAVPFFYVLGLVGGLYVFPRLIGFSERSALSLGLVGALGLAAGTALDKLAPLHAASVLGVRPHVASLLVWVFFTARRGKKQSAFSRPEARWALLAFYLGTLLRLMGLFHPEFYYPDVRTHSKFVSLIWTEGVGGFLTDHIAHQHDHLLGLQLVGGRWLAFPYPPLLYLLVYPLSLLQLPVDDWMKMVPAFLVGIEALVVFSMAHRLGASARAAALATWVHATAPVVAFRLTVASYAALLGHFWDTLVVLYLVVFLERLNRFWAGIGLALLIALSILSYAGSVLVLGLFIPTLSFTLLLRREKEGDAGRALLLSMWALGGALVAIASFYSQYVPELAPGWLDPSRVDTTSAIRLVEPTLTPLAALRMAAHRVHLFYGPFYGILSFLGLAFLKGRFPNRLAAPVAVSAISAFLGMNFLRSGLGGTHIFQFSKDDLVLLPLAAIVLGGLADRLSGRGRAATVAAAILVGGWVVWGCVALGRDVQIRFRRPEYPPSVGRSLSVSPMSIGDSLLDGKRYSN